MSSVAFCCQDSQSCHDCTSASVYIPKGGRAAEQHGPLLTKSQKGHKCVLCQNKNYIFNDLCKLLGTHKPLFKSKHKFFFYS